VPTLDNLHQLRLFGRLSFEIVARRDICGQLQLTEVTRQEDNKEVSGTFAITVGG
jgi:hypothetical protein